MVPPPTSSGNKGSQQLAPETVIRRATQANHDIPMDRLPLEAAA
jgi:hypothetical protein